MVPAPFAWPEENVPGKTSPHYGWPADHAVGQRGLEACIEARLAGAGVDYLPLRPAFERAKLADPGRLFFYERDGHWNAAGHRVVFEALRSRF
jgi:hypothetical protein